VRRIDGHESGLLIADKGLVVARQAFRMVEGLFSSQ